MFRRSNTESQELQFAASLLKQSQTTVVLTGAGVSTPSGIPDFRSDLTGLWTQVDPFEVASIWGFRNNPQRFYDWLRPLAIKISQAKPNPAHLALAEMERNGIVQTLITQNIDALHQRSGSTNVIELHGHVRTIGCLECDFRDTSDVYIKAYLAEGSLPICPSCGFVMKPDVVLMGESLAVTDIVRAQEETLRSQLMLVAGSSLETMPAADLPALAVRSGAKLIIANFSPTPYDHLADVILRGDVADVLPRLAKTSDS